VYALLETAVRGRAQADRESHQRSIAELWSGFSDVAASNPCAKLRRHVGVEELLAARPVSAPYTKLLTANADVDLATGLIMCSSQAAADAGVPRDRWVFPLAAAHAQEEWFVSERADLAASPAIRAAARAALEHAQLEIDEVAHVDIYSCFPSAVQIAAAELGLAANRRPLTVTGGLTFAGGPGNNYTSHAIAALVERLRAEPDGSALCTAVGWYLTKHAALVLSGSPGRSEFEALARLRAAPRATTTESRRSRPTRSPMRETGRRRP
jgi:acetyl-CoA C-acetyltransferase